MGVVKEIIANTIINGINRLKLHAILCFIGFYMRFRDNTLVFDYIRFCDQRTECSISHPQTPFRDPSSATRKPSRTVRIPKGSSFAPLGPTKKPLEAIFQGPYGKLIQTLSKPPQKPVFRRFLNSFFFAYLSGWLPKIVLIIKDDLRKTESDFYKILRLLHKTPVYFYRGAYVNRVPQSN